jgi:hypothetical protein
MAPSSTPGGTFTVISSVDAIVEAPLQVAHGCSIFLPLPPHDEQGRDAEKNPRWNRTSPAPWHAAHLSIFEPFAAPVPSQPVHGTVRGTCTARSQPRADSSKEISTSSSTSLPCRARFAAPEKPNTSPMRPSRISLTARKSIRS